MKRTSARTAAVGAAVLVAASAAAVVGLERSANGAPPPVEDISAITFKLDRYLPTRADLQDQQRGREILLSLCVERFTGSPYIPEAAVGVAPAFSHYRFGLANIDVAQQHGYHDPADELGAMFAQEHPVSVPAGEPTRTWLLDGRVPSGLPRPVDPARKALPTGGCASEADRLVGERPAAASVVEREINGILSAERSDPRVRAAVGDWATCMQKAGYNYDSTVEPVSEYGTADAVTDAERKTAVADATCRAQTDYLNRRIRVLNELQRRSISKNRSAWDGYRRWQDHRTRAGEMQIKLEKQVDEMKSQSDELLGGTGNDVSDPNEQADEIQREADKLLSGTGG